MTDAAFWSIASRNSPRDRTRGPGGRSGCRRRRPRLWQDGPRSPGTSAQVACPGGPTRAHGCENRAWCKDTASGYESRTACHLGGRRAWFRCAVYSNGRYCGRRVGLLYGAGELFACRRCYGLAYASQREAPMHRGVNRAQKIRMRLGGSANLCEPFPEKPKRMHWRTYHRLRAHGFA